MTSYRILMPTGESIVVTVAYDHVTLSTSLEKWMVGLPFPKFRRMVESADCTIVPLLSHPDEIVIDGRSYELHWRGDTLVRVTLHTEDESRDLTWSETPALLRDLI